MRLRVLITLFCLGMLATGCFSTLSPTKQVNTSQAAINKQEKKILSTAEEMAANEESQKNQVSMLAAGTQYSLNQVTNPSVQVKTAQKLNERIVSIVGAPNLDDLQKIHQIVDYLNSEVDKEKSKGASLLASKDKEITKVQKEAKQLEAKYDSQIEQLKDKIRTIAKTSDDKQATINQMSGFMGLNAVFWGLKTFLFTSLTWVIVFAMIFLILRIASATNPIAAAAFSIFNIIGSFVISLIKGLTPKAFDLSHLVKTNEMIKYKTTLTKIVDVVQEFRVKENEKEGDDFSLNDFLTKLSIEMDQKDKDLVEEILIEQKWKR